MARTMPKTAAEYEKYKREREQEGKSITSPDATPYGAPEQAEKKKSTYKAGTMPKTMDEYRQYRQNRQQTQQKELEWQKWQDRFDLRHQRDDLTSAGASDADWNSYYVNQAKYGLKYGDEKSYMDALNRVTGYYDKQLSGQNHYVPAMTKEQVINYTGKRYAELAPIYEQMAQDAAKIGSQDLYDRAKKGYDDLAGNYSSAYSAYIQAMNDDYKKRMGDLEKSDKGRYLYQTTSKEDVDRHVKDLQTRQEELKTQMEEADLERRSMRNNPDLIWYDASGRFEDNEAYREYDRVNGLYGELQAEQAKLEQELAPYQRAKDLYAYDDYLALREQLSPGGGMTDNEWQRLRDEGERKYRAAHERADTEKQEAKQGVGDTLLSALSAGHALKMEKKMTEIEEDAGVVHDFEDARHLNTNDADIFYVLYAQDPEKAAEFIHTAKLQRDDEFQQYIADSIKDNPFLRWTAGMQGGAVAHLIGGAANLLDPYSETALEINRLGNALSMGAAQGAEEHGIFNTGALAGKIDENTPVIGDILGGKGLGDAYQLGTSMVESGLTAMAAAAVGDYGDAVVKVVEFLGTAIMGSSAAASDYDECIKRGLDRQQAMVHATSAGIAEAAFEYISLDKLVNQDITRGFVKNFFLQGGIEASEEACTTIANRITDAMLARQMGYDSSIEQRVKELMALGVDRKEAEDKAEREWLTELFNDAIGGFISGGFMTAGNTAMNWREYKAAREQNRKAGATARWTNQTDALRKYAEANDLGWYGREIDEEAVKSGVGPVQNVETGERIATPPSEARNDSQKQTRQEKRQERQAQRDQKRQLREQSKQDRQIGSDTQRVQAHIQEQFSGKSIQEQTALRDKMIEQYGNGIAPAVYEAISVEAAKKAASLKSADEIREARDQAVNETQDLAMKRAIEDGYDQAVFGQAMRSGNADEAGRYFQQLRNTGEGGMTLEATVKDQDGQSRQIAITGMTEDGKGVKLADGTTVAVSKLQADADTMDAVQRIAELEMGTDADAVLQAYIKADKQGVDGYRWLMDYSLAYEQGRTNKLSLEEAVKRSSLDRQTVMDAYTLGQREAHQSTRNAVEALKAMPKKAGITGKTSNIDVSEIEGITLNESEREQFEFANKIFSLIGVDVKWVASAVKNGRYVGANGSYLNGAVTLDVHAGRNFIDQVNSGILATTGHELTHLLQQYAPEQYQALKEFLFKQIVQSSANGEVLLERMIWDKQRRASSKLSRRAAEDEVVADACQTMLRDSKAIREFAQQDEEAAKGVVRWLDKWLGKLKQAFSRSAQLTEEARFVDSFAKEVREAFGKLWDEALREAVETHDRVGNIEKPQQQNSDRDSTGRELSEGQKEYFKDSKILDKYGNLLTLYHGTAANFTVFDLGRSGKNYDGWSEYGSGIYLTPDKKFATYFSESASQRGGTPKLMELYANIKNPFNVNDPVTVDVSEYAKKYKLTEDDVKFLKKNGDRWLAFMREHNEDIYDFLTSHGYDGLWDAYGTHAPTQIVAFTENQVKNSDNKNPTENLDIRFSMREPVEQTDRLIAWHNMNEDALRSALELGGLAMPSWAIKTADRAHTSYGKISVIAPRDLVDPKRNRSSMIFGGDAWTPVFPGVDYEVTYESAEKLENEIKGLVGEEAYRQMGGAALDHDNISSALSRTGGTLPGHYSDSLLMKYAYLRSIGKDVTLPQTGERLDAFGHFSNEEVEQFVHRLVSGKLSLDRFRKMSTDELMQQEDLKAAMTQIREEYYREKLGNDEAFEKLKSHGFFAKDFTFSKVDAMLRAAELYYRNNGIKQTIDKRAAQEVIDKEINKADFEKWALDKLNSAVVKKGIRNEKDTFTPSGNRRSFDQLHYAYNLANIVKAMKAQPKQGRTQFLSGPGSVKGAALKSYNTVDQVRKDRGRLVDSAEEGKEAYDAYNKNLEDILDRMSKNGDRFDAADALIEVFQHAKTEAAIYNYMQREMKDWYNISRELAHDAYELIGQINALPMEYFEGKTYDAVRFDETAAVVVPDNIDPALKQQLEDAGARVIEYAAGDDTDRLAKVNSVEGAQFSERDYDNTISDYDLIMEASDEGLVGDQKAQLRETKKRITRVQSLRNKLADTRAELKAAEKKIAALKKNDGTFKQAVRASTAEAALARERVNSKGWERVADQTSRQVDRVMRQNATLNRRLENQTAKQEATAQKLSAERINSKGWERNADLYAKQLDKTIKEKRSLETKLANQIKREQDIIERKLTPPAMQKLLTKERQAAEEKVKQHKDEVFANYKERKSQAALRGRIKNLHDEMRRDLLKPREGHFVPQTLIRPVVDLLDMVNTTQDQTLARRLEDLERKIQNAKTDEQRQALEDQKTGLLERIGRLDNKIAAISAAYDAIKKDERYSEFYDETVKDMLVELGQTLAGRSIYELNSDELADVYTVMKAMRTTIRNTIRADLIEKGKEAWEIGNQLRQELRNGKGASPELLEKYHMAMLSAKRAFNRFGGYLPDSAWNKVYQMLDNAQLKMLDIDMRATRIFDPVMSGKENLKKAAALNSYKEKDLVDVGLKDADGNAVKITRGMMLALYMHLQNEENMRHAMYGGLTLPDYKRYYNNSGEAWGRGTVEIPALGAKVSNLEALLEEQGEAWVDEKYKEYEAEIRETFESIRQNIEKEMTDYDRQWIECAKEFFDDFSRRELNAVTNSMYGFSKAKVDNYFPIVTDKNFLKSEFDSVSRNISLENAGFMKERVKASNPILLEDLTRTIIRQKDNVSRYAGLTEALKTFGNVYNTQTKGFTDSVKKAMAKTYGKNGQQYIENLITDMIGGRTTPGSLFDKIKGNYAQAVLSANLSVTIKQAASLPTAAATVGWKPIMKALARGGRRNMPISRADTELINTYTPLLYYRSKGSIDTEIGELPHAKDWTKKAKWLMGWIQGVDKATVGRLWYAAEYYVKDHYDLEQGTAEQIKNGESPFYQKVAEVFRDIVEDTQPNYTVLQRPDILRNPNKLVRAMTMFSTQRFQNANILIDSVNEYAAMVRYDKKNGTQESKAARKAAKTKLTNAISSQVVSAVVLTAMTLFANMAMHRMNPWRDDDDELTQASIMEEFLDSFLSTMAGSFLGGSELYEAISSILTGSKYYGNDVGGISTINDFATAVVNFGQKAVKLIGDEESKPEDWTKLAETQLAKVGEYLAQMTGVPIANINKIISGGKNHIIDIMNGEFLSFEAGVERSNKMNANRFYKAWEIGDSEKMQDILTEVQRSGKSEDSIASAFNKAAKDAYENNGLSLEQYADYLDKTGMFDAEKISGKIKNLVRDEFQAGERSEDEAISALTGICGMDEDAAWKTVQRWEAGAEHEGEEDYSYSQYEDLREALDAGKSLEEAGKEYLAHGYTEEQIAAQAVSWLKDQVTAGKINEDRAIQLLRQYKGMDADKAWKKVQEWKAKAEHAGDEDYSWSQYDEIDAAIDGNKDIKALVQKLTSHGVEEKSITSHVKSYLIKRYEDKALTESQFRNQLSRYCGIVAKKDVDEIVNNANCFRDSGFHYSELKTAYNAKELTGDKARQMLIKYGGLSRDEAKQKTRFWDFEVQHPDANLSIEKVNAYYDTRPANYGKTMEQAGISVQNYISYCQQASKATGTDKDGDGRTDSGSKKAAIMRIIDSLSITKAQKDALYYYNGWSAKTINEAPWH